MHVSLMNKIIIPLDPLLTNILASREWTVNPVDQMYHFIVAVERLFHFERSRPGTTRRTTSVEAAGARVWATSLG